MTYRYFNITYECQCACVFCVADVPLRSCGDHMPYRDLVRAALDASPGDTYVLSGGEPTLHPGLVPIVRLVTERGARTVLQTNGVRLGNADYARELVDAGVSEIGVPLHSASAAVHDSLVGLPGAFDSTLEGIKHIQAMGAEAGSPHLEIKLLISRLTLDELPDMVDVIAALPARPDSVVLKFLVESRWTHVNAEHLRLSFIDAANAVGEAVRRMEVSKQEYWLAGFPLCVLEEDARLLVVQRHAARSVDFVSSSTAMYFDSEYCLGDEEHMEGTREVCPQFDECSVRDACPGPEPTYVALYGDGELEAVRERCSWT